MSADSPILIASDHAGFKLKKFLLTERPKLKWNDLGCYNEESVDYPTYAEKLSYELKKVPGFGVLICGSGQGMAIKANRNPHIRAAICWNEEVANLARAHNDANVLCLGARVMKPEECLKILETFLNTNFEGGRHQKRVDLLSK